MMGWAKDFISYVENHRILNRDVRLLAVKFEARHLMSPVLPGAGNIFSIY